MKRWPQGVSKVWIPAGLALAGALCWAGPAPGKPVDRVVAVVGSKAITLYELEQAYTHDPQLEQNNASVSPELPSLKLTPREYLDHMVENQLIDQEVERQGIKIEPMEVEKAIEKQRQKLALSPEQFQFALGKEGITLTQYRDKVKRDMIVLRLVGKEVRSEIEVTDAELHTYYQQHPQEFLLPDKVSLQFLLIPWPDDADASARQAYRRRIGDLNLETQGEQAPAALAQTLTSAGIPAASGDLGWFNQGELDPKFEEHVRGVAVGQRSPLFETDKGIYSLLVKERVTGEKVPFEKAKEQIQDRLYQAGVMEKYGQWLERLKARSHVEIHFAPNETFETP